MSKVLGPCLVCRRHAWLDEAACPFCGGELGSAPVSRSLPARATRAAIMAGSIVIGSIAVAACGPSNQPKPQPAPTTDPGMVALYGAPAPEGSTPPGPDGEPADPDPEPQPEPQGSVQPEPTGAPVTLYGAPPE